MIHYCYCYIVILLAIANVNRQFPDQKRRFSSGVFYGYTMVNDLIGQDKKITNDIKLLLKHASFDQEKTHKNKQMIRTYLMFCT